MKKERKFERNGKRKKEENRIDKQTTKLKFWEWNEIREEIKTRGQQNWEEISHVGGWSFLSSLCQLVLILFQIDFFSLTLINLGRIWDDFKMNDGNHTWTLHKFCGKSSVNLSLLLNLVAQFVLVDDFYLIYWMQLW